MSPRDRIPNQDVARRGVSHPFRNVHLIFLDLVAVLHSFGYPHPLAFWGWRRTLMAWASVGVRSLLSLLHFLFIACAAQGWGDVATAAHVWGACYTPNSAASTPTLSVLPGSSGSSYSTTWASTSAASPVLDLCNQVQSIWLLQGE